MAVSYACHVYNSSPNAAGIAPADLFTKSTIPQQPRSCKGIFLGLSSIHSSEVPYVLNLQTGSITTQYHVVFDNLFTTVESLARESDLPDHWADLCLKNTLYILTDAQGSLLHLQDEWLTPAEHSVKQRDSQETQVICNTFADATLPPPSSGTLHYCNENVFQLWSKRQCPDSLW